MLPALPVLPGYDIQRLLGQGAFGLVYLALDLKNQELCAVKEFPANPTAVQTFFRELSALFTLDHPNIIRCLNLIHGQGPKNYLVLEYAERGALRHRLIEGKRLSEKLAFSILRQIALGLEEAHRHEIIHGDLKPENILICRHQTGSLLKISDLGLAICGGSRVPEKTSGSPAYMAPEQFYDHTSVQSDLYSLGVILYELLCGVRPFEGTPAILFLAHRQTPPDLSCLPSRASRQLVSDLLSKQPFLRPSSATEVIDRLDARLSGKESVTVATGRPSVTASPPPFIAEPSHLCLVDERSMPGSRQLFAPEPRQSSQLWISDDRNTDHCDLSNRRFSPQVFAEPVLAGAPAHALKEEIFWTTPRFCYFRRQGDVRSKRLFAPLTAPRVLQVDLALRRIYLADARRISASTFTGQPLWRLPCENYHLEVRLHLLGNGQLAVSIGPAQPAVLIIDSDGVIVHRVALPGPVLELGPDEDPNRFFAIVLGLGAEEPTRRVTIEGGCLVEQVELGESVYSARYHRDFLAIHATSGHSQLLGPTGTVFAELTLPGNVLSEAWLPRQSHYAVLLKEGHRTMLRTYQLRPQIFRFESLKLLVHDSNQPQ